ncbi:MAG: DUF2892 domain-containing protein [Sphingobacteriales bacterium]|nr:MAG: DUF2892 domain-containing protein [Sphingobacteriales bacterium]
MKKNMGSADRVIRLLIAGVIILLYGLGILTGVFAIVLLVLAGIFILTSFVSFCPLYTLFGVNSCRTHSS